MRTRSNGRCVYFSFCVGLAGSLISAGPLPAQPAPDVVWSQSTHGYFIAPVAVSPNGDLVAVAGTNSSVRLVRLADGAAVRSLPGQAGAVGSMAFSRDGTLLAATAEDRTLAVWDVATGTLLRTIAQGGGNRQFTSVAFHPDGQHVAADLNRTSVSLWKISDGASLWQTLGNSAEIQAITFSPEGALVAVAGGYRGVDVNIRIIRASDGALLQTLATSNSYGVRQLAFSPDGQWLVAGCHEGGSFAGSVEFWRVADWTQVRRLPVTAPAVAFSPNGKVLVTVRREAIDLWSFPEGAHLGSLGRVGTNDYAPHFSVAVSPAGERIVAGFGTGTEASATAIRFPTLLSFAARQANTMTLNWVSGGPRVHQVQRRLFGSPDWENVGEPTTNGTMSLPLDGLGALIRVVATE